jgi:spore coat protein U-like protein
LRFYNLFTLLLFSATAFGYQATSHFGASAVVAGSCTSGSLTGTLNFGAYDPHAGALTATGTITMNCTLTTQVQNISLDDGKHVSGGIRHMKGSNTNSLLQYHIYKPTGANISSNTPGTCSGATQWGGNGTIGTRLAFTAATGTFHSTSTIISVCGQIPSQPTAVTDGYIDTVLITVNYL